MKKVVAVEMKVTELSKKIESNSKLYEKAIEECQKKIDRTEMDDLRNGMEKERCKINYFQDKISNIAKSVDGVKIENNNMSMKVNHLTILMLLNFQETNFAQTLKVMITALNPWSN